MGNMAAKHTITPEMDSVIVHCDSSLKSLKPILRSWFKVQREYADTVKGDLPWWYLERPQIGLLAAAAVKEGAIALEEWGTKKGQKKHKTKTGRNDLWLQHKGREWFIEAKYHRCNLSDDKKTCTKSLVKFLKKAKRDADKVIPHSPKSKKPHRLGILFASPLWEFESPKTSDFQRALRKWKQICGDVPANAVALLTAKRCEGIPALYDNTRLIGMSLFLSMV
jgi:hypothetical protein